jgi:uncharacterized protein YecE (DUF72 family)
MDAHRSQSPASSCFRSAARELSLCDDFFKLLRDHGAAWVIADTARLFPYAEEVTSDFIYIRLHGSKELYASGYDDAELTRWAKKIRKWTRGSAKRPPKSVYVYFDNDAKVYAPFNASRLACMLNLPADARLLGGRL